METSHLVGISHSSKDNAVLQSKSTNVDKYLLLAIGIIILLGSIIATGCLYSRLGYSSFAIGGIGLILGVLCFLFSTCCNKDTLSNRADLKRCQIENRPSNDTSSRYAVANEILQDNVSANQQGQNIHASADSIRNRLPCRHEGNSCFVNSALQIMAHLPDLRNLFDKDRNHLENSCQEEDACLNKRKRVQEIGNELIDCILEGRQVRDLGKFIDVVNNALMATGRVKGDEQLLKFDIQAGGDAALFISCIENILSPDGLVYGFPSSYLNQFDQISEDLSQEKSPPSILVFDHEESCTYRSEIIIKKIGTYRLAAVRISTGNHSIPIICSQSGQYFKFDDVVGRAEEISKDELSNILTNNKQSPSAYYVKAI
jgi:Ubiquitin carboxyl-terminal hydrolase